MDHANAVLATKHGLFFRSILVPSLALGLTEAHDNERQRIFAGRKLRS
jgi:hypothetical protein